jgi:hypothetical protein
MYTFLILGLVPGTHIQITFQLWLQVVASMLGFLILSIVTVRIYRLFSLSNKSLAPGRSRLHATQTQLRQRVQQTVHRAVAPLASISSHLKVSHQRPAQQDAQRI